MSNHGKKHHNIPTQEQVLLLQEFVKEGNEDILKYANPISLATTIQKHRKELKPRLEVQAVMQLSKDVRKRVFDNAMQLLDKYIEQKTASTGFFRASAIIGHVRETLQGVLRSGNTISQEEKDTLAINTAWARLVYVGQLLEKIQKLASHPKLAKEEMEDLHFYSKESFSTVNKLKESFKKELPLDQLNTCETRIKTSSKEPITISKTVKQLKNAFQNGIPLDVSSADNLLTPDTSLEEKKEPLTLDLLDQLTLHIKSQLISLQPTVKPTKKEKKVDESLFLTHAQHVIE